MREDLRFGMLPGSATEGMMPVEGQAKVLVVDDDASVRRSLRRLLRSAGYTVEEFASAREFLEREAPPGPVCVILDVRMPQMTGLELFERMVRDGVTWPVIFLTGHGDVRTGVHTMKKGAVDYLLKPVDSDALLKAVRDAIGRHALSQALEKRLSSIQERLHKLSPRERQVMEGVARGWANKVIAADLGISEKTVKVHRHRVMEKMGAGSVAELVRLVDAVPDRPPEQ